MKKTSLPVDMRRSKTPLFMPLSNSKLALHEEFTVVRSVKCFAPQTDSTSQSKKGLDVD